MINNYAATALIVSAIVAAGILIAVVYNLYITFA